MLGKLIEINQECSLKHFSPKEGQVFYYPAGNDKIGLQMYIVNKYKKIKTIFKDRNLDFVYPPLEILGDYSESSVAKLVSFYLPWENIGDSKAFKRRLLIKCSYLLESDEPHNPSIANCEGRQFILYPDNLLSYEEQFRRIAKAFSTPDGTYFECEGKDEIQIENNLMADIHYDEDISDDSGPRFSFSLVRDDISFAASMEPNDSVRNLFDPKRKLEARRKSEERPIPEQSTTNEDELERMFRQLRSIMPDHSIREMLSNALKTNEVVSRLVITEQYRILLPDYNDLEIKLTPKEKAFYFLFLRHPEGLELKLLPDHKKELGRLYRKMAKRDLKQVIEDTIENMVSPFTGDAHVQRSRIKIAVNNAFENMFCKDLAQWYTINGAKGEKMKIELPQNKIIWKVDL